MSSQPSGKSFIVAQNTDLSQDFLQLRIIGGKTIGWVDSNGTLSGSLGAAPSSNFSFGFPSGCNLPNVKFISAYKNVTGTGNTDLYTVPAGRRAFFSNIYVYNTGSTSTISPQIKIAGSYYILGTSASLNSGTPAQKAPTSLYVAEAGESLAIASSAQPINVWAGVVEFDNSSALMSSKIMTFINGDNTVYTVSAGKTALLPGFIADQTGTSMLGYINTSGGTRAIKWNIVPSGGSPGTTNLSGTASVTNNTISSGMAVLSPLTMNSGDFISINSDANTSGQLAWVTTVEM